MDNTTTLGDVINLIRLPAEDPTFAPQFVEALPPLLVHDYLMIASQSVLYNNEQGERRRYGHGKNDHITLPCFPMEKADKSECPCAAKTGCYWYKSVNNLPSYNGLISKVTLSNGRKLIAHTPWEDIGDKSKSFLGFLSEDSAFTVKTYMSGDRLFIESDCNIDYVSPTADFTNFAELQEFICGEDADKYACDILSMPFTLHPEYGEQILATTLRLLSGFFSLSNIADTKADLRDGSKEGVQP